MVGPFAQIGRVEADRLHIEQMGADGGLVGIPDVVDHHHLFVGGGDGKLEAIDPMIGVEGTEPGADALGQLPVEGVALVDAHVEQTQFEGVGDRVADGGAALLDEAVDESFADGGLAGAREAAETYNQAGGSV